jgi:hypothetical protein
MSRKDEDELLARGVFFDVNEHNGTVKVSLSEEAERLLTKAAARQGLDLQTFLDRACQQIRDKILAKKRGTKR